MPILFTFKVPGLLKIGRRMVNTVLGKHKKNPFIFNVDHMAVKD